MDFTGERVIPGQTDPDLMNEHRARYRFAEGLVEAKTILDAGGGVGYGSLQLAQSGARVFSLDFSADALCDAARDYKHERVHLLQGDCAKLPFPDHCFEAVVAFEVIEHVEDWAGMLAEVRRVLAAGGLFIVSTPNKLYYDESRKEPNPFHVHEFDYDEFVSELGRVFSHTTIFLENHTGAITFTPLVGEGVETRLEPAEAQPAQAHFFLAICSDQPLSRSSAFVYVPRSGNVLREREHHIRLLQDELRQKETWLKETSEELKKLSEENVAEQQRAQRALDELEQENRTKTQWAEEVKKSLASTQDELQRCVELLDRAEATVVERSSWAQSLDADLTEARLAMGKIYSSPVYRVCSILGLAPRPPAPTTPPAAPDRESD